MSNPTFCGNCGTKLDPANQFCPKCGKEVTLIQPAPQLSVQGPGVSQDRQTSSAARPPSSMKRTIRGIDKRIIVVAILLVVVLVLPVFPRHKVIHVSATTMVTQTLESTSYSTAVQTVTTTTQQQIQVYQGYISQGTYPGYYCYYSHYYGRWMCPYSGYGSRLPIVPADHVVKVDYFNLPDGTLSITLYSYEGRQRTFRDVYGYDLTLSGTSTVIASQTITNTSINTIVNPHTNVVAQDASHDVIVTERVSILQLLLGI